MQIAVSLIFTRFMNLFSAVIPVFETTYPDSFAGSMGGRLLFLALAIVLTGVGAALSLFMRIVPNPGDGLVQGISDFFGLKTGLSKNIVEEYGGVSYDITEYTMSEIIASVYDAMEETGVKRGMTRRWRRSSATPNGSDSASSGCLDLPRP